MRPFISCLHVIIAGTAISCGDSTGPRPSPASLEIVSGEAQEGTVATELPALLRVRVLDGNGSAIEGQLVNFIVMAGGGSVSLASDVTNSDGVVQDRWTLGRSTADNQSVEARVANQSGGTSLAAVFHATPRAAAPDTVRVVSGDDQSAEENAAFPDSLLVRVSDRFGNPVAGEIVALSGSPGVTLSQLADTTTAAGYASVKVTADTILGAQTIWATVAGRSTTFTVHVTRAVLTVNDLLGRHALQSLRGQNLPVSNVPFAGATTTVDSAALEILPNGTAVVTEYDGFDDSQGKHAVTYIRAGVVTINGDSLQFAGWIGVVSHSTITSNVNNGYGGPGPYVYARTPLPTALPLPGRGVSVTKVSGDSQSAKLGSTVADPLVVRVLDGAGQPVSGQTVRFSVVDGNGSVADGSAATDAVTDANGLAQVVWTLGNNPRTGQSLIALIVSTADRVTPTWVYFYAEVIP